MDLLAVVTAYALVLPVELPDKTFVATLVLATRYPPRMVWLGVAAAFLVQSAIAVTVGGLLSGLPRTPVLVGAALLFAVGAVVLWRSAEDPPEDEEEIARRATPGATGLRAAGASFLVLFLAEWGDLSQLLTAGLAARTGEPLSVWLGAWLALVTVSGLGVLLGRALLRRLRLATVRRVGAGICAVLATVTALEVVRSL